MGYWIEFDSPSIFSIPNFYCGKNVVIFGVQMSSSVHIDNIKKHILILGKGPTQRLDDTTLSADSEYFANFSRSQRKVVNIMEVIAFHFLKQQNYANLRQNILKYKNIPYF